MIDCNICGEKDCVHLLNRQQLFQMVPDIGLDPEPEFTGMDLDDGWSFTYCEKCGRVFSYNTGVVIHW